MSLAGVETSVALRPEPRGRPLWPLADLGVDSFATGVDLDGVEEVLPRGLPLPLPRPLPDEVGVLAGVDDFDEAGEDDFASTCSLQMKTMQLSF